MRRIGVIIVAVILGVLSYGQAQIPIDLTNFNIEQGLSNYRVHAIHKGQDGFVWIGTDNGLNRFDGSNFKIYHNNPADTTTISKGKILKIDQDKDGILWFVTDGGGLNSFNPITEKVMRFFDKDEHRQLHWSYMKDLIIQDDTIWVASWGGLIQFNRLNYQTRVFTWNSTLGKMRNEDVKSMSLDKRGLLWLGTTYGVSVLNTKTMNFVDVNVVEKYNAENNSDVRTLYLDSSGNLWIGKIGSLLCLNLTQNTIHNYTLDQEETTSNIINSITEDYENHIWVGTENGVFVSEEKIKEGVYGFYQSKLPSTTIHSLLIDNNQFAWIGTGNNGLYINNNSPKKITHIEVDKNGNIGKEVRSIMPFNKEELLFSTYREGIVKYNTSTQEVSSFLKNKKLEKYKITALLLDKDNLWFGTLYNGLFVFNVVNKSIVQVDENGAIISLSIGGERVVVGTSSGLRFYDRGTFKTTGLPKENEVPVSFYGDYIEFVYRDKSNNFWISSSANGLCVLDSQFRLLKRINFKDEEKVKPYSYTSIYEGDAQQFYLGTNSGLINKYVDYNGGLFFDLGSDIEITGIIQDQSKNFWISSSKGVYLKHKGSSTTYNYFGKKEGFNSYQFFSQSVYSDSLGNIYFGGANGVDYFNPKDVVYQEQKGRVIINGLLVHNKPIQTDTIIPQKREVVLNYKQNVVTFNYSNLGFEKRENNQYRYILKGLSSGWITVQNQNTVSFANLLPGNYEFVVQSGNKFGVWDAQPASIKMTILPPFWMTWQFYGLCVGVFLVVIFVVVYTRINRKVKE